MSSRRLVQGGRITHITVGVDIATSGASNADRAAIVVERTDMHGSRVELALAQRGVRPTDLARAVQALVRQIDSSAEHPRQTFITVAVDRTGDAGTAEMIADALHDAIWRCTIKVRRVWIASGDGEEPPKPNDKTDRRRTKWSVGRDHLYPAMLTRLRTGDLDPAPAQGEAAEILKDELRGLSVGKTPTGRSRIDHGKGGHDDVSMALALADWAARSKKWGGIIPVQSQVLARSVATGSKGSMGATRLTKTPRPKRPGHASVATPDTVPGAQQGRSPAM